MAVSITLLINFGPNETSMVPCPYCNKNIMATTINVMLYSLPGLQGRLVIYSIISLTYVRLRHARTYSLIQSNEKKGNSVPLVRMDHLAVFFQLYPPFPYSSCIHMVYPAESISVASEFIPLDAFNVAPNSHSGSFWVNYEDACSAFVCHNTDFVSSDAKYMKLSWISCSAS